jgi:hypothetical protein
MAGSALALLLAFQAAKGPYEAPDREPTPQETLILEYMNRFRANPAAEAEIIAPPGTNVKGIDWKMFHEEMKALKPAPPLVFNLDLLDASRKHSYYMVFNGLTHDEVAGKPAYFGANPGERCRLAGYKGGAGGENAFAGSGGPWDSHWGFVVDFGAGPGGMQPLRGHRTNMINPRFREVGPGGVPNGKGLSVTHDFGSRDTRLAGGVVYIDLNGNGFYDIGEGLGHVTIISSDGGSVTTWKSGAFAMDLKGQKEVTLTAFIDGEKSSKTFPAGAENVKFDWIVPQEVALRKADKYLGAVEAVKDPASAKYTQSLVNLYMNTQGLYLDADRKKKVGELTKEVGPALDAAEKAVLDAYKGSDPAEQHKAIDEQSKPYHGTDAEAWFKDAELVAKLQRGVTNFQKQASVQKVTPKEKSQFVAALDAEGQRLKTVTWKQELSVLETRVKSIPTHQGEKP